VKYIRKTNEPQSFTNWKNLANENWQPTYDELSGQVKKDVKNALIHEQGSICCYCETKLKYDDSHIEHLDPQSNNEEGRLNYNNMLCSCQQKLEKGEPRHCGNSKENYIIPITPLMQNCENKFEYTADGQILHTDVDSNVTMQTLNLDIDKLNKLREKAIEPFIIDPDSLEKISREDAKIFADKYLEIEDGKYNEFYTTIKYLFG